MNKLLLIVDCQNAFVNEITEKYVKKINSLVVKNSYDKTLCTQFRNDVESPFYKLLGYRKCLNDEDCKLMLKDPIDKIEKQAYSAVNDELLEYIAKNNIDEVYLCGFDTDGCVLKTALDLFENNIKTYILQDYCMSSGGEEYHNSAITILKRSIGNKHII